MKTGRMRQTNVEYLEVVFKHRRMLWGSIVNSSKTIKWNLQIFEKYKVALKKIKCVFQECRTRPIQSYFHRIQQIHLQDMLVTLIFAYALHRQRRYHWFCLTAKIQIAAVRFLVFGHDPEGCTGASRAIPPCPFPWQTPTPPHPIIRSPSHRFEPPVPMSSSL